MDAHIKLQLTPVYTKQAPSITLNINGKTIFNEHLNDKIDFKHVVQSDHSLRLKIKRSGRTKSIIDSDPGNGFIISKLDINGVKINPDVGSYQCTNNDYLETHTIHGKHFTSAEVKDFTIHTSIDGLDARNRYIRYPCDWDSVLKAMAFYKETIKKHNNGKHFTLNGEYFLEIPHYTLRGQITKNKDRFDITGQHHKYCFFGASMTDWNFKQGTPPIYNKENYADLFMQQLGGINLASSGQTNQEIFETVYKYLKNNKVDVCLVQLIGTVGRQVKNANTKEIYRWSPHTNKNLDHVDEFTKSKLKNIQEYFVYLDTTPILALQMSEYQKLISYAVDRGSKIFFISYFRDEYDSMKQVIPNNMAPYFDLDPNTKYCKDNGYHATPEEQENYFQSLVDFIRKIT